MTSKFTVSFRDVFQEWTLRGNWILVNQNLETKSWKRCELLQYDDQTIKELIDDRICHTNTRFRNFKEKLLSLTTLFDFHKMATGITRIGILWKVQWNKGLVCRHLDNFFLPGKREEIPVGEFCLSKSIYRCWLPCAKAEGIAGCEQGWKQEYQGYVQNRSELGFLTVSAMKTEGHALKPGTPEHPKNPGSLN